MVLLVPNPVLSWLVLTDCGVRWRQLWGPVCVCVCVKVCGNIRGDRFGGMPPTAAPAAFLPHTGLFGWRASRRCRATFSTVHSGKCDAAPYRSSPQSVRSRHAATLFRSGAGTNGTGNRNKKVARFPGEGISQFASSEKPRNMLLQFIVVFIPSTGRYETEQQLHYLRFYNVVRLFAFVVGSDLHYRLISTNRIAFLKNVRRIRGMRSHKPTLTDFGSSISC